MKISKVETVHEHNPRWFYDLPFEELSDAKAWGKIAEGDTNGIFQLETNSFQGLVKDFKPVSEEDAAALIAVNRPGVTRTGMLNVYLDRRLGKAKTTYLHPLMEPILKDTFGVVVYQEQVMKIVQSLAGYSLEESDKIRKIMGKMLYEQMKLEQPEFIRRCCENEEFLKGCGSKDPGEVASNCWQQIEAAGIYSFNLSHSLGYSFVCTWGALMKSRYIREYLTALMQTDPTNVSRYVREARVKDIPILPPDINQSEMRFTLTPEGIRYGLDTVKGVGPSAVKEILGNRPFESMEDFYNKTSGRGAKKVTVVRALISVGAFDKFGDRTTLLREFYESRKEMDKANEVPDFSNSDVVLEAEMQYVGDYITRDPAEKYYPVLESGLFTQLNSEIDDMKKGTKFNVAGQINKLHEHQARNGLMAFLELSFGENEPVPITVFADKYSAYKPFLEKGTWVCVKAQRLESGCCLDEMVLLDYLLED